MLNRPSRSLILISICKFVFGSFALTERIEKSCNIALRWLTDGNLCWDHYNLAVAFFPHMFGKIARERKYFLIEALYTNCSWYRAVYRLDLVPRLCNSFSPGNELSGVVGVKP